jgi:hypothetical protein
VEVKSSLVRDTVPRAIYDMLNRDDALGAVVLNNRIHDMRDVESKPVFFLPLSLTHCVPSILRNLC